MGDVNRPVSLGDQCYFTNPTPSWHVLDVLDPDAVTPAAPLDEENGKGWMSVAIASSPECVIRTVLGVVVDSASGATEGFQEQLSDHKGALASDPIPTPVPVAGGTVALSSVSETTVVSTSGEAFKAGRMASDRADRQYVVDWTISGAGCAIQIASADEKPGGDYAVFVQEADIETGDPLVSDRTPLRFLSADAEGFAVDVWSTCAWSANVVALPEREP